MSQLGEAIKISRLDVKIGKCPFKQPPDPKDPDPEDEDYAWDDRITIATAQANSGGKLGGNLEKGSPGEDGTWNVLGGNPDRYTETQIDTGRANEMVKVQGISYPYTVAAHHLIPGNASLYVSRLFKQYMKRGGKVEVKTLKRGWVTMEVSHNIGYNVNGSHNGVWLPGSYAIVAGGNQPRKLGWEALNSIKGDIAWCVEYMAVVAKKAGGQFHDTHTEYNKNALKVLEKGATRLYNHQVDCDDCQTAKKNKVPPPYAIKARLYRLSKYFRQKTQDPPSKWKGPWWTSDQVNTDIFSDPYTKRKFRSLYSKAAK